MMPKTEADILRWEKELGVPRSNFKARLAELAGEALRSQRDYKKKQVAGAKREHGRNPGSLKKRQAKTRHAMLMSKGRTGHSANRAKSLRGGRV